MAEQITVEDFFYAIFRDDVPGFIDIGLIGKGKDRPINHHTFFEWPKEADKLFEFINAHADEDVYFSPMLFPEAKRGKGLAKFTPVLWADTDEANPYGFDLDPSIVVETSPGRWHAYWCLAEDVDPSWAETMSKRITDSKADEGSDHGWAIGKLLRVPHTTNTKPGRDPFTVTVEVQGNIYMAAEVEKVYGVDTTILQPHLSDMDRPMPDEFPPRLPLLARIPSDPRIDRALNVPDHVRSPSESRWFLENEFFRLGFTAEEVFSIIQGTANDKYTRDNRPLEQLWKEILKAERASSTPGAAMPPEMMYTDVNLMQLAERAKLLTDEERTMLEPTFIDEYVEWAKTRTNGDVGYHYFGAMCILSTIFADFGFAIPQFGKLGLNLWFMVIGDTTRTYKTTAKKLMLEVLSNLNTEDYQYDAGSDATPEGMVVELAKHPDRSMLMHRDEANSLLEGFKGGKAYLSGFGELLTELYDGHVRSRVRASQQKTEQTNIALSLYLLGVPDRISEAVTADDFASGFLARFLYVVGEPEPFEIANQGIRQMSLNNENKVLDVRLSNMQKGLLKRRTFWSNNGLPQAVPVPCTDEAWDRFNKVSMDLAVIANKSDRPKVLEPSANRMNKMILKLATLLAMYDMQREVSLRYMLTAIHYAEGWYQHLCTVVNMVGLTEFAKQVDAIVEYVSTGRKPFAQVRRAFKNMPQRQWQEALTAAQDQGLIKVGTDGKSKGAYIERV